MENHPIPQQISSYQFRLVGDMTLKQFFQVGGGALIAILIYSSGLPVYIKWPLIIISFLLGVALAFFPLEDRPLSKWLFLFIKSIYAPTLYVWMTNYKKPNYFQPEGTPIVDPQAAQIAQVEADIQPAAGTPPALEQNEQQFLDKVQDLNDGKATPLPQVSDQPQGTIVSMDVSEPQQKNETERTVPDIPTVQAVAIEQTEKPITENPIPQQDLLNTGDDVNPMAGQMTQNAGAAQFSDDAAPPIPPNRPNVVVGQVMDNNGKIVENAILEIKDAEGRPARALRSNKLGHFMIVTPLSDGAYTILTEKDGLTFEPITITAGGEIIPPIAIRAKHE